MARNSPGFKFLGHSPTSGIACSNSCFKRHFYALYSPRTRPGVQNSLNHGRMRLGLTECEERANVAAALQNWGLNRPQS
jgi:hypothetical protein